MGNPFTRLSLYKTFLVGGQYYLVSAALSRTFSYDHLKYSNSLAQDYGVSRSLAFLFACDLKPGLSVIHSQPNICPINKVAWHWGIRLVDYMLSLVTSSKYNHWCAWRLPSHHICSHDLAFLAYIINSVSIEPLSRRPLEWILNVPCHWLFIHLSKSIIHHYIDIVT